MQSFSRALGDERRGRPMQYASKMIRAFEPADEGDMIRVWLASTIPGRSFLPEEHWRAMEPEIRQLVPKVEIWVVEARDPLTWIRRLKFFAGYDTKAFRRSGPRAVRETTRNRAKRREAASNGIPYGV